MALHWAVSPREAALLFCSAFFDDDYGNDNEPVFIRNIFLTIAIDRDFFRLFKGETW